MLYQNVTNLPLDAFKEKAQGKKVVILYPWTNYRNLFLSYFLHSTDEGLLYYRIPDQAQELSDWLKGLYEEMNTVLPNFGQTLRGALQDNASPQDLARALAVDLGDVRNDQIIFYLDEIDRIPHDDIFRDFVFTLVDSLPQHVQLVVNSRLLTYHPWVDLVERGDATVLGTSFRRNNLMFTVEETPKPQLEIYAFGRGHVLVNGREITNWDGALPRNLFFFFVDNNLVTRDEIFEVFWPKLSIKEATNVFHVTKRKITERISTNVVGDDNYELTQYSAGFYKPSDKVVRHYDVADFTEALDQALTSSDDRERETLYRRAIDIYKAPFLETIDMPWVMERREKLRLMYADALIGMGRLRRDVEDYETALGYFVRALREMPQREDIHREVMTMYWKLGRLQDATEQYERLKTLLDETIGVPPSRETRELHKQIQAAN